MIIWVKIYSLRNFRKKLVNTIISENSCMMTARKVAIYTQ